MDEYVRHTVQVDLLARKVLDSPVYHRFFAAAPGLPELMVLGKIMVPRGGARAAGARRPRYDLVIVDAPATGHGLSLLKVPLAASRGGARWAPSATTPAASWRCCATRERTALVIVAIPEEMAVVEALEFHRAGRARRSGSRPRAVVLNACHERRFTDAEEAEVLRLAARRRRRPPGPRRPAGRRARGARAATSAARKLTRFYAARLRRRLPPPLVTPALPVRRGASASTTCGARRRGSRPREARRRAPASPGRGPARAAHPGGGRRRRRGQDHHRGRPGPAGRAPGPARPRLHHRPLAAAGHQPRPAPAPGRPRALDLRRMGARRRQARSRP